jgi:hypothetical protein
MKKQNTPTLKMDLIRKDYDYDRYFMDTGLTCGQLGLMELLPAEVQQLIKVNGIPYPLFKAKCVAEGLI